MRQAARVLLIGTLHTVCYLWLLPEVILPRFGRTGSRVTVTVLVVVSIVLLSGMIRRRRARKNLPGPTKS